MFTRLLAILLTTSCLLLAAPVFAQTAGQTPGLPLQPTTYNLPTTVSPTSPLYTDLLLHNMFHSFSCIAIGQSIIGQPCLSYQMTRNAQGMLQGVPVLSQVNTSGGALGVTTSLIGALYTNPPVRTADYLASVGQGLGIVKTANAQVVGSGAAVLNPILKLWQVSRNISYVLMIIIFLIIGLMVMFRNKINPQTVITAQAALPGLVIGLIMITFSFFFAGLISDVAFIGTNVVGYYFSAVRGQTDEPQNLTQDIRNTNVLNIFTPFTKIVDSPKIADALGSIWNDLAAPTTNRWNPFDLDPQKAITNLAMFTMTQFVLPFGGMFGGIGQAISGGAALALTGLFPVQVVSLALSFVAMIILIYAMLRLLMRLINNYISIIFLTISAPFQFLAAALPGRQGIATNWILNMLSNILAFPAVLAVFYFVAFILGANLNSVCPQATCPFIISSLNQEQQEAPIKITDSRSFPLFGGFDLNFLNLLLAFGALIALPSVPDIIGKTVGKMSQAGQLIGQEIGSNIGQGQKYAGQFQQGVGGFANQVGQLRDQPGYVYRNNQWVRVTGTTPDLTAIEKTQAGLRPGLVSRVRGFFR